MLCLLLFCFVFIDNIDMLKVAVAAAAIAVNGRIERTIDGDLFECFKYFN